LGANKLKGLNRIAKKKEKKKEKETDKVIYA
jgi:hypothetical protein